MKGTVIDFDFTRFGGVGPLTPPTPPPPPDSAPKHGGNTESVPSVPSKTLLLIVDEKMERISAVGKTIRNTGDTGDTRDSPATPQSCFHYASGIMQFGDICVGWAPASWSKELRRKADHCDTYRPDIADYYRRWADDIDAKLGRAPA